MNLKRIFYLFLGILGLVGTIVSAIQFTMSISFGELGRVIVYLILALICIEILIYAVYKIIKSK